MSQLRLLALRLALLAPFLGLGACGTEAPPAAPYAPSTSVSEAPLAWTGRAALEWGVSLPRKPAPAPSYLRARVYGGAASIDGTEATMHAACTP
ncbi:MAG: hypothetical protein R3F49_14610 [Planctomycetota bacterium]